MNYDKLIESAIAAKKNSYSPFSQYRVGAALLTKSGKEFRGTNIENSSYGLTVCAERVAVFKAVSEGHLDIEAIAVVTREDDGYACPCGACRQVLVEFNPNMDVIQIKNKKDYKIQKAHELLPDYFVLGKKDE